MGEVCAVRVKGQPATVHSTEKQRYQTDWVTGIRREFAGNPVMDPKGLPPQCSHPQPGFLAVMEASFDKKIG